MKLRRRPNPEKKNPPSAAAGLLSQSGSNPVEKDYPSMTATPLFRKPKVTPETQLAEWLKRGEREVFCVTTLVTPALADLLLANNESNRPIAEEGQKRSVAAYAAAMLRGEWVVNGEAIIVSRCGQLNDGQHRLRAVLRADCSVMMQIAFGVERDTRHTVDQGMARSPGHIFAMRGEVNTNVLATAVHFMWCIDTGGTFNQRASTDQLIATLDAHPGLRDAVRATDKLVRQYRLSSGYVAGAHYLARHHNAYVADQYVEALTTGLNIRHKNSPVARLRRAFEDHKAKLKGMQLPAPAQAAFYIKGFNNFCSGRTGPIIWRQAGPAAEAFPIVGG